MRGRRSIPHRGIVLRSARNATCPKARRKEVRVRLSRATLRSSSSPPSALPSSRLLRVCEPTAGLVLAIVTLRPRPFSPEGSAGRPGRRSAAQTRHAALPRHCLDYRSGVAETLFHFRQAGVEYCPHLGGRSLWSGDVISAARRSALEVGANPAADVAPNLYGGANASLDPFASYRHGGRRGQPCRCASPSGLFSNLAAAPSPLRVLAMRFSRRESPISPSRSKRPAPRQFRSS